MEAIVNLFRSRTFTTALIGAIFAVIVTQVPTLQPYTDTIVPLIVTIILAVCGGELVETAAKATVDAEKERTIQAQMQVETARIQAAQYQRG